MQINQKQTEKKTEGQKSLYQKLNDYTMTFSRVPLREKLFFVQHLGLMLKSGISLSVALKTLARQSENKYFQMVLNDISSKVEKGTSFKDSLSTYKKIFGELFISMIEAGEMSGKLEEVLGQLFIQMKKEHRLLSKVKGALTYPAVILIAMFGIGTFLMVVIIPRMTSMFLEMGVELPLPTRILIGLSSAIANNGIITLLSFIFLILLFIQTLRTHKGKFFFESIILKLPIIAPIIKKINLARFSRSISSLLKTDIMIIKTFQITGNVLGNLHYRHIVNEMAEKIKKGSKISEVVNTYPDLFPPIVAQMIAVGEETGELDNILVELAEFYEEEIDQIMENLPSIIEPLLILILGLGVGAIAVSIIMPMYSITEAI